MLRITYSSGYIQKIFFKSG